MGNSWITYWREKVRTQWKLAFISAFLLGLIVHFFKFSNTLLIHDSVYSYYQDQNMVGSGRWLLSIACGISSYFDLPWINGVLAIFYLALTTVVIVDLFHMENPVVVILTAGIIVSMPAVTETFFYGYTADGYMLAALLAALTARFSTFEHHGVKWIVWSAVLLCLSCGIYQVYVSFALLIVLFYFVDEVLHQRRTNRECWYFIGKQVIIFAGALIAYYVIWKLCMKVQNVQAYSYLGIDTVSSLSLSQLSPAKIWFNLERCFSNLLFQFFEKDLRQPGWTAYTTFNVILLAMLLAGLLLAFWKGGLFKRGTQLILAVLALLLCVPCAGIWYFASDAMHYRPMMFFSLCMINIFVLHLYQRWIKECWSNIVAILTILIIFNNALIANISYQYMDKCIQRSHATAVEMSMRIHQAEEPFDHIIALGNRRMSVRNEQNYDAPEDTRIKLLGYILESDLLYDQEHIALYLEGTFGFEDIFIWDEAEQMAWYADERVQDMAIWPARDSMQVMDGTLVIKLSEIQ